MSCTVELLKHGQVWSWSFLAEEVGKSDDDISK
jgi:hypothetical protein